MYKLQHSPLEYSENALNYYKNKLKIYRRFFFTLNLVSFLAAAFSTILTALFVSKLIWASYENWFFFATAGSSALAAMMSSLLNFYVIKDSIAKFKKQINLISKEEVMFHNKSVKRYQTVNREYNLYLTVGKLLDNKAAKKEVKRG